MCEHLAVFRLDIPQLEDTELVDCHVSHFPALPAQEGLLGVVAGVPPVLAEVHVGQLLVEVEIPAPVLG